MSTPTKFAARSRLGSDVPPSPYSPGKLSHSLSNEDGAEKKARRCVFYVAENKRFSSLFFFFFFPIALVPSSKTTKRAAKTSTTKTFQQALAYLLCDVIAALGKRRGE